MLESVIGLEIHVQLKTKRKMFCGCANQESAAPNRHVCEVCLGQPGVLPIPNAQAITAAARVGLALGAHVAEHSKFDRKHYFYPDLPKGYQISQFDEPVVVGGVLDVEVPGSDPIRVRFVRAHLEEDAAKNLHDKKGETLVDFNRAGAPLLEMVTEPDLRSPAQAKAFLQELRLLCRTLGISDADMEKGQMRCDANISLRERDETGRILGAEFNPKTEIKNINSFRAVERALAYEIKRQTELWEAGTPPAESTTRGWNDVKQVTRLQRTKESSGDYRYFPEPDIPPLKLAELAESLAGSIPELPGARRARFVEEYKFSPADARQICDDPRLADFTEAVFSELAGWIESLPELESQQEEWLTKERARLARLVSGWLISKLLGLLHAKGLTFETQPITAENFAEFITLLASRRLSTSNGLTVLERMLATGKDPSHLMEDGGLGTMDDAQTLTETVRGVIASHSEEAVRYQNGEIKLFKFFVGLVMKETEGKADPNITASALNELLGTPKEG